MRNDSQAVSAILAQMDGEEWTPDTLDAIADILRSAGHTVRTPDEYTEDLLAREGYQGEEDNG